MMCSCNAGLQLHLVLMKHTSLCKIPYLSSCWLYCNRLYILVPTYEKLRSIAVFASVLTCPINMKESLEVN